MGFEARKKLIARKRECSTRVGRSRASDCGGVVCVGAKDLRFISREFHKRGEELRNDPAIMSNAILCAATLVVAFFFDNI